ncbi:MAG: rhodanese-like domain-containing protein [Acidobacteriota bacterium]|jgi:rhodanese-related sulfurtransferase
MYVKRVSPEEAEALMQDQGWAYVDVRSVPEFEQGHPAGAYNVPLAHMGEDGTSANADFLPVMERHFPKDASLVLGCRTSNRAEHAVVMLLRAGYTNVAIQRAGFLGTHDFFGHADPGWGKKDLPTSQQAEAGRSWAELNGGNGE